ncbi:MAG: dCMP deaminase family protein [Bacilli bacterium]|nr:dCMP deaminase family protein [Bacilli bacterium]
MKKDLGEKRKDYINWDEYFMAIAKLTAARSKDPNTQVGACIVSSDNRLLSAGYNGAPNNYDDDKFPWKREGKPLETKYMFVCHAEANAIDNFRGYKKEFEGARLYVDLFPCNECAKRIIQSGIKEVIYLSDKYKDTDSTIASKLMFDTCGVTYRELKKEHQKTLKISLEPDTVVEYIKK